MSEADDRTPKERLADLERMDREQDARLYQNECQREEAVMKARSHLIAQVLGVGDEVVTKQLQSLIDRLIVSRAIDPDELDDEPKLDVRWIDQTTRLAAVGLWIGGILYFEHPSGALYAERRAPGYAERAIVSDDDGSLSVWRATDQPKWN
jgi:hypothetical protein